MAQVIQAVENAQTLLPLSAGLAPGGLLVTVPQSTHASSTSTGVNQIKLPLIPTAGWKARIAFSQVGDNVSSGAHNWAISSGPLLTSNMSGTVDAPASGSYAATNVTGITTITRSGTSANALPGDWVDIWADGSIYLFYAHSGGTASPFSTTT